MAYESQTVEFSATSIADSGTQSFFFAAPEACRVLRMFGVSESEFVADGTVILNATLIDGDFDVGVLTNDSGETAAASAPGVTGVAVGDWGAKTGRSLSFTSASANGAYEVDKGGVLELKLHNLTGDTVTDIVVGIEIVNTD